MKISKEDLPEDILYTIKYVSEKGLENHMNYPLEKDLEDYRLKALDAIKKYKELKLRISQSKEVEKKYQELAKKLGL